MSPAHRGTPGGQLHLRGFAQPGQCRGTGETPKPPPHLFITPLQHSLTAQPRNLPANSSLTPARQVGLSNEVRMQRDISGAATPPQNPTPPGWWGQRSHLGGEGGDPDAAVNTEAPPDLSAPQPSAGGSPHPAPAPSPPWLGSTPARGGRFGVPHQPHHLQLGDTSRAVAGPHSGQAGDIIPAQNWPRFSPSITPAPQKAPPGKQVQGSPSQAGAAPSLATPAHAYSTGCTTTTEYSAGPAANNEPLNCK